MTVLNKLKQIDVEPLSDQRWAKIERSLAARLTLEANGGEKPPIQRRRRVAGRVWLLVAALVGALGGVALAAPWLPRHPVVEQPSRITTGSNPSHLALSGLSLDVQPQSAVIVGAEAPQGLLIVLDRGSIVCDVAPRPSDAPLIVQAGATRVRVVGTRFSVTRLDESARVEVRKGVVEVSSGGSTFRVGAGEHWPNDVAPSAALEPVTPAGAAPPTFAGEPKRVDPSSARPTSAPKGLPVARTAAPEPEPVKPPAPASRQAVFEQAALLERSDPARASELYASLEAGRDSWAQNALYGRGRLEATRGNRVEARRLLERYLERFPNGGNAEDARAVLTRLR